MGNQPRYEVWKVERDEKGDGYRWAIWDNEREMVILSGVSPSGDDAVQEVKDSITFLIKSDQTPSKPSQ
jgi:hypothetical protein